MTIGVLIGTYFALKHIKEHQTPLKYGMIVALSSTIISGISLSFFDLIVYSNSIPLSYIFFVFFNYFLVALVIGLPIGIIEGLYFRIKISRKNKDILNQEDDKFYESLASN